jgi:pimeloyl-ACP methyl ester carboxylesterase
MEHFLQTRNTTLCYLDEGNKDRHPLVFVHAFPLTKESWELQAAALSDDYRILRYDIAGLGKSLINDCTLTMDTHVSNLISLLDHCQIGKCTLIGLSMGGYIALHAISKYPERFQSIILANTRADADSNKAKEKRFGQIELIKNGGISQFAETLAAALLSEQYRTRDPGKYQELITLIKSQPSDGLCSNIAAMASRLDFTETLFQINIPTLVITSDNDSVIPIEEGEKIGKAIPHTQLVQIGNAGHLSNLEQPVTFSRCIREFVGSA